MPSSDAGLNLHSAYVSQHAHQGAAGSPDYDQVHVDVSSIPQSTQEPAPEAAPVQGGSQAEQLVDVNEDKGQYEQHAQAPCTPNRSAGHSSGHHNSEISARQMSHRASSRRMGNDYGLKRVRPSYLDDLRPDTEDNGKREIYCTHNRNERCSGTLCYLSYEDWPFDEDMDLYRGVLRNDTSYRGESGCGVYDPRSSGLTTRACVPHRRGAVRCHHDGDQECSGPLWCLSRAEWPSDRNTYHPVRFPGELYGATLSCGTGLLEGWPSNRWQGIDCGTNRVPNRSRTQDPYYDDINLRGGHGGDDDIQSPRRYREPTAEDDFDTFGEHRNDQQKCKERNSVYDQLRPQQQEADDGLDRLRARLRAIRLEEEEAEARFRLYLEETRGIEKTYREKKAQECERSLEQKAEAARRKQHLEAARQVALLRQEEETERERRQVEEVRRRAAHERAQVEARLRCEAEHQAEQDMIKRTIPEQAQHEYRTQEFKPRSA